MTVTFVTLCDPLGPLQPPGMTVQPPVAFVDVQETTIEVLVESVTAVSEPLIFKSAVGVPTGGVCVVALTDPDCAEIFPAASNAATVKEYAVDAVSPVDENPVALEVAISTPPR